MRTPPRPVVRNAARVLLVDPDERLLLVQGGDGGTTWWFTPGGGVEPGEDLRAAAIREVLEETGHRLSGVEGPVAQRSSVFPFEGRLIEQRERFFLARVPAFTPSSSGWTELERRVLTGQRWWTLGELRSTDDTVYPPHLADLVERVLREGPGRTPRPRV